MFNFILLRENETAYSPSVQFFISNLLWSNLCPKISGMTGKEISQKYT